MSKKTKRNAERNRVEAMKPKPICPNCNKPGPHYVPPSMGDEGFFACEALNKLRDQEEPRSQRSCTDE